MRNRRSLYSTAVLSGGFMPRALLHSLFALIQNVIGCYHRCIEEPRIRVHPDGVIIFHNVQVPLQSIFRELLAFGIETVEQIIRVKLIKVFRRNRVRHLVLETLRCRPVTSPIFQYLPSKR